jgi:hypothetical protein
MQTGSPRREENQVLMWHVEIEHMRPAAPSVKDRSRSPRRLLKRLGDGGRRIIA